MLEPDPSDAEIEAHNQRLGTIVEEGINADDCRLDQLTVNVKLCRVLDVGDEPVRF